MFTNKQKKADRMKWFSSKKREAERVLSQQEAAQAEQAAQWEAQGLAVQEALRSRLLFIVKERYVDLPEDDARFIAYVTYRLMTGASEDRLPNDGATDDEIEMGRAIAIAALTEHAELRDLALRGAHTTALYWLVRGIDFATMTPIREMLEWAEASILYAIELAEAKATYLSTAVQINMTWGRYERALEIATLAVEAEPTNPEAVRMKGMATFANGDLLGAKQLLERAWQLSPGLEGVVEPLQALEAQLAQN